MAQQVQLYAVIIILGIIILYIMWFMTHKIFKANHALNIKDNKISDLKYIDVPDTEIIQHNLDKSIDLISSIHFKHCIEGDKIQNILYQDNFHHKINIHGMSESKQHCNINANYNYYGLFFSTQLASKNHIINEIEFSHFVQYIQKIAIFLDGDADIPSMQEVLTKAQELKELANNCMQYLQFKILLKDVAFTQELINWIYSHENKYKALSSNQCIYIKDNCPIYSIEWPQQEHTQVLYFYYTPALVLPNLDGLKLMCDDIEIFMQSWSSIVCTPDNQLLNYTMYEQISKNIQGLYATIEQHNLQAGSTSIKRLLSYN